MVWNKHKSQNRMKSYQGMNYRHYGMKWILEGMNFLMWYETKKIRMILVVWNEKKWYVIIPHMEMRIISYRLYTISYQMVWIFRMFFPDGPCRHLKKQAPNHHAHIHWDSCARVCVWERDRVCVWASSSNIYTWITWYPPSHLWTVEGGKILCVWVCVCVRKNIMCVCVCVPHTHKHKEMMFACWLPHQTNLSPWMSFSSLSALGYLASGAR